MNWYVKSYGVKYIFNISSVTELHLIKLCNTFISICIISIGTVINLFVQVILSKKKKRFYRKCSWHTSVMYFFFFHIATLIFVLTSCSMYFTISPISFYLNTLLSQSSFIISDAFSPIMYVAAFVWPATISGIIDESTTRRCEIPYTWRRGLTTAVGSDEFPIRHVPTWTKEGYLNFL